MSHPNPTPTPAPVRVILASQSPRRRELLAQIGPKVPSNASADHGAPFAEVFARYNGDFYKIDPQLFSPAEVVFQNLDTGRVLAFGHTAPGVLRQSFLEG